jgi:hypothetical protein
MALAAPRLLPLQTQMCLRYPIVTGCLGGEGSVVKHMRRGVVSVAAFRSNDQSGKSHRARALSIPLCRGGTLMTQCLYI